MSGQVSVLATALTPTLQCSFCTRSGGRADSRLATHIDRQALGYQSYLGDAGGTVVDEPCGHLPNIYAFESCTENARICRRPGAAVALVESLARVSCRVSGSARFLDLIPAARRMRSARSEAG